MTKKVTFSEDTKGSRFDFSTPVNLPSKMVSKTSKSKQQRDKTESLKDIGAKLNTLSTRLRRL